MMLRRWILIVVVLLLTTPAGVSARWIKDKVYLQTKDVGTVEFSHANHLDAVGKNCQTCHNEIYHIVTKNNPAFTMADMEAGKACGACHNGKERGGIKAFSVKGDCVTCHGNGTMTFETDAGKATFSHEVHTAAFGCDACHPAPFKAKKGGNKATMEQMEKGASCGSCHDGSTAFGVKDDKFCAKCHEM